MYHYDSAKNIFYIGQGRAKRVTTASHILSVLSADDVGFIVRLQATCKVDGKNVSVREFISLLRTKI